MNSNFPLGIRILHWVKPLIMHGIVILYCLYKYTERKPIWYSSYFQFMSILLIILWWFRFLVPRSCARINMVSELTVGRRSISQKQDFWQISPWKVSNSSKIQHCTKSQGLPLNTPSKELVDQACLIGYAGCDESLNVQAVWPYGALFVLICRFYQVQLWMDSSIPLLTPFTSYSEWKLKMIASLKRWGLYEVSIGIVRMRMTG